VSKLSIWKLLEIQQHQERVQWLHAVTILGLSSGTFQRCMGICEMTLILVEEVTRHSIHAVFQNSAMFHYSIWFSYVQLIEVANCICVFSDSFSTAIGIVNSSALVSGMGTTLFPATIENVHVDVDWNNECFWGVIYWQSMHTAKNELLLQILATYYSIVTRIAPQFYIWFSIEEACRLCTAFSVTLQCDH